MEAHKKNEHVMFELTLRQCNGAIKNKVESDEVFDEIDNKDDAMKLLALIKSFTYGNKKTKYVYWTVVHKCNCCQIT